MHRLVIGYEDRYRYDYSVLICCCRDFAVGKNSKKQNAGGRNDIYLLLYKHTKLSIRRSNQDVIIRMEPPELASRRMFTKKVENDKISTEATKRLGN